MLFELFVVGTFWFWVLLAVEFCFLIYLLEHERYIAAPFTLLGVILLLTFCGSSQSVGDILRWIVHNPLLTIAYAVGYFAVGALYVSLPYLGKWWWFVRDVRDHNRDEKQRWLGNWKNAVSRLKDRVANQVEQLGRFQLGDQRRVGIEEEIEKAKLELAAWEGSNGVMTAELLPYWKEHELETKFYDVFGRSVCIAKPTPDKFKGRIISWIIYWPPSMFWTLLNDPLRRIGRRIYDGVAGILRSISDSAWKDEDKLG